MWFRNDLRIHDNPVLDWAINQKKKVISKEFVPVFCFDPRQHSSESKFCRRHKTGIVRTRFLLETVNDFRTSLNELGSSLLVAKEKPEKFMK